MMYRTTGNQSEQGFSLIELLVAIIILAISASIAVPSYRSITTSTRLVTEINDLVADIHFARSEAIKRGHNVSICTANKTFTGCELDKNWGSVGWVVIDGTEVIKVRNAIRNSGDQLIEHDTSDDNVGIISFNRYGYAPGGTRSLSICDASKTLNKMKGIVITSSARVRSAADVDGNGVVEDVNGKDMKCGA